MLARFLPLFALTLSAIPARAMTPVHGVSVPAATSCHLQYGSGALMHHVKVVTVFWGAKATTYKDQLSAYYAAIVQSPFFDWLREYDQGTEIVRRGSFGGAVVDSAPPTKTLLDDLRDIQPHLSTLIAKGTVPAPDDDTIYMIHFPTGVTISQQGATSCNDPQGQFCAYHSSFEVGGQVVRYGVIPDMTDPSCAQGCGTASGDAFVATTVTASHELVEAVTDPDGGSGWIDQTYNCGEIGDICADKVGAAAGFSVQKEWSNKQGACVDHDTAVKVADFALALDQAPAGAAGASATAHVQSTAVAGTPAGTVGLTVDGLPAGVTATLGAATVPTSGSTSLTLAIGAAVAPGSYDFTITGATSPDNVVHALKATLTVTAAAPSDPASDGTTNPGTTGTGTGGGTGGGGTGGSASGGPVHHAGCSMGDGADPTAFALLAVALALFGLGARRRSYRA